MTLCLVWLVQYWLTHDESLDFFEHLLLFFSPMPFDPGFEEVVQWGSDLQKVGDEAVVEIGKTLECTVLCYAGRDLPFPDTRDLDQVHHDRAIF